MGKASKKPAARAGTRRRNKPQDDGAPASAPQADSSVRIRFYCQGIGDCHLLRFNKDGGHFWMLIDCGVHSSVQDGAETMDAIVDDILLLTKRLDVIVLTHEHWDHASGFLSAQEKFSGFTVGEIWLAWTEDPTDPQARALDKFKGDAFTALQGASQRLDRSHDDLTRHLAGIQGGLREVLGFVLGAKGEKVRAARNAAIGLAKGNIKYWEPDDPPFTLAGSVPNIRVYVLGPPRDAAMLRVHTRASEMYELAGMSAAPVALALNEAFRVNDDVAAGWSDATAPFDPNEGFLLSELFNPSTQTAAAGAGDVTEKAARNVEELIHERYQNPEQTWRRIDNDWLGVSADLAIQLDKLTNNSSLVLAFEFVDTRRVLLFVGDAQVGNWLSWEALKWPIDGATVSAHDLLARTIFYKVGHHGSENATLRQKGLELMVHPDLSAFIPTNKEDAKKVGWGEMPFESLLKALNTRASNRVIRADDPWVKQENGAPAFGTASGSIKAWRRDDSPRHLWVELDIG